MERFYSQRIKRQKKERVKSYLVIGFMGIMCILFIGKFSLPFFANGADYILRPLIGSGNTIVLESIFFEISDVAKQAIYHVIPPSKNVFASGNIKHIPTAHKQKTQQINLMSLPYITAIHPFPHEGVWQEIPFHRFQNQIVMAKTIVSPDAQRPYAYVALVKMAIAKLGISAVAGTVQPGGPIGNPGKGKVPAPIVRSKKLIAAFDGGFQYKDGAYGMKVGSKTYVPLKKNLATFIVYKNGSVRIMNYKGHHMQNAVAVRQNGALLIDNGHITQDINRGTNVWGLTVTNSMYTWRSGIGITKNGNLLYAVGPSLVPQTLAKALQAAGAVNAMQLDINPYWVRFELYNLQPQGAYTYRPLLHKMAKGGYSYLHGYQKDFFYVYAK